MNEENIAYMKFNNKNKEDISINIKLKNYKIKKVEEMKYLGILKIITLSGMLRKCKEEFNEKTKYLVHHSFIDPHLKYFFFTRWSCSTTTVINKNQENAKQMYQIYFWAK